MKRSFLIGLILFAFSQTIMALEIPAFELSDGQSFIQVDSMVFFDKELLTSPSQAKGKGVLVSLPHDIKEKNTFGTYFIKVDVAELNKVPAILVNRARGSHSIYVNDNLYSEFGKVAGTEGLTIHRYLPSLTALPVNKDIDTVAIQIANFTDIGGALGGPVLLGDYDSLSQNQAKLSTAQTVVLSVSIILCLFFTISFYYGKDSSHLALALLGAAIFIRQGVSGIVGFRTIFPTVEEHVLILLEYITPYFIASFMAMFVYMLLHHKSDGRVFKSRILPLLRVLMFGLPIYSTCFGLFLGVEFLHKSLFIIVITTLLLVLGLLSYVVYKKHRTIMDILSGIIASGAIVFSTAWDLSVAFDYINGQLIGNYTLLAFLFIQVLVLFKESKESEINYVKVRERNEEQQYRIDELEEAKDELNLNYKTMAEHLILAKEEQIRAVNREMHDLFSQPVVSTMATLKSAADDIVAINKELAKQLMDSRSALSNAYKHFRQLLHNFRPASLDINHLATIIEFELSIPAGITTDIQIDSSTDDLSPDAKANLFRICQEAAANMIKYSEATLFQIHIQPDVFNGIPIWQVFIMDNGIGANLDELKTNGISNIQFRFEVLKGDVEILSSPSAGFTYNGWVPQEPNKMPPFDLQA